MSDHNTMPTRYSSSCEEDPGMKPAFPCKCTCTHSTPRQEQSRNHESEVTYSQFPEVMLVSELPGCTIPASVWHTVLPTKIKPSIPVHLLAGQVDNAPEPLGCIIHEMAGVMPDLLENGLPAIHPSTGTPMSPPPPYSILHDGFSTVDEGEIANQTGATEDSMVVPQNPFTYSPKVEENDAWVDPITSACRRIMETKFPSPTFTLFDDYSRYREHVQASPNHKWYLNFRYLSLVLQPELPFQVFLVDLEVHRAEAGVKIKALLYAFENCIVFAHSNAVPDLPDPNAQRDYDESSAAVTMMVESGLEILEEVTIKFDDLMSACKVGWKHLVLDIVTDEQRTNSDQNHDYEDKTTKVIRYTMKFKTTCQRHKVFQTMSLWNPQHEASGQQLHDQARAHYYHSLSADSLELDLDYHTSARPHHCNNDHHSYSYEITSCHSASSIYHHERFTLFHGTQDVLNVTTPRSMLTPTFDHDLRYHRLDVFRNGPESPFHSVIAHCKHRGRG